MLRHRARLCVEQLEARDCPALTLKLIAGSLYVCGVPTGVLSITETGANLFKVQSGATPIGTFLVPGNIQVKLTNRPDDVNVQLNATGLGGNLLMDLGR